MGVIDHTGKVIIPVIFDRIDYTGAKKMVVTYKGKPVWIDQQGNLLNETN